MKIIPVYDEKRVLRTVRFRIADESVRSILEWFGDFEQEAIPLKQFLSKEVRYPSRR